jgi:hypothetical protein
MKKLTIILMVLLFSGGLLAQNITNTLPTNGNYIIKDATNVFFTLAQTCGNVCIGGTTFDATNPEKLKVDAGVTSSFNVISGYGSINSYLQLNIKNSSNGTYASSDIVATNDIGTEDKGYIDVGINSSNYSELEYKITGKNDGYIICVGNDGGAYVGGHLAIGTSSTGAAIKFFTGGTSNTNERMRIDASGNVGIGTTAPAYKFQVKISGSNEGHVTSTGTWSSSSDVRLKKNINPVTNSLEYIMSLNPVRFDMKTEEDSKTGNHFGFIAQEMEKYLPELVGTDNEGMKSIEYATLTSILTGAVKEQQATIESQKKDIEQLKADMKELKSSKTVQSAGMNFGGLSAGFWVLLSFIAGSLAVVIIKKRQS